MKKLLVKVRDEAEQDLLDIWQYISFYDEERAAVVLSGLHDKINMVSVFSSSGVSRNDFRVVFYEKYAIYYLVMNRTVFIVRILHGARKVKDLVN